MIRLLRFPLSIVARILSSCSSSTSTGSARSVSQYLDPAGRFRATLRPGWEVYPTERGGIQFINSKSRCAITLILIELPISTGVSGDQWKPLLSFEAAPISAAGPGRSVRRWTGRHGSVMVTALYDYDDSTAEAEKADAEAILVSIEFSGRGSIR